MGRGRWGFNDKEGREEVESPLRNARVKVPGTKDKEARVPVPGCARNEGGR